MYSFKNSQILFMYQNKYPFKGILHRLCTFNFMMFPTIFKK